VNLPAHRPMPRIYLYRHCVEQKLHPQNGCPCLGFGIPVGRIGEYPAFSSVVVRTSFNQTLTEDDLGGPMMVKVWSPESPAQWFAVAHVETIERVNAERKAARKAAKASR
jgi:hypothetical protein